MSQNLFGFFKKKTHKNQEMTKKNIRDQYFCILREKVSQKSCLYVTSVQNTDKRNSMTFFFEKFSFSDLKNFTELMKT